MAVKECFSFTLRAIESIVSSARGGYDVYSRCVTGLPSKLSRVVPGSFETGVGVEDGVKAYQQIVRLRQLWGS